MHEPLFSLLPEKQHRAESQRIISCNALTASYGLQLSQQDTELLLQSRSQILSEQQRVEFSGGILPRLIECFCDSDYLRQDTYLQTLLELQELFYIYKNESLDLLTDDELLAFMKEQFNGVCYGSVEYLGDTCLDRFSAAIRAGYEGYKQTGGKGVYAQFSQEERWDKELFLSVLKDLIE